MVADMLEAEGRQVVEEIAAGGGQARFVRLDVTQRDRTGRPRSGATVVAFGKLDVLVNNAGISGTIDPDMLTRRRGTR